MQKAESGLSLQKQVVAALLKPEAYEEDPGRIELVQTHISFIFLTKSFVYKVKKAVDFGFLNFITLEKRRFFCEKELELNRRLCGDMYLKVVPISKSDAIKIGGKGETIEYAVKMKRIPQESMLSRLIEKNKVDSKLVASLARTIAEFHSRADTNKHISEFGSIATIETNWTENINQTRDFVGETISAKDYAFIHDRIGSFLKKNVAFFERRMAEGRVRDCHGDIHSDNIFIADRTYIFDAIEFNERFRYSDVASDVAFLAMDLDFRKRSDLSKHFAQKYVERSEDRDLMRLLPFYKCYRAYVRGKVLSFKMRDPSVTDHEKRVASQQARSYFGLASAYAHVL